MAFSEPRTAKLTDARLLSEQQGPDAAQGKASQQSGVVIKYVGAVS